MRNEPLVSIVVPSYNQADYLEECLLSLFAQQRTDVEVIVMDGGSDDGSLDVIQRHKSRLAYWRSEKDEGQAHAINEGFAIARGAILGWLNSDDLHMPSTLKLVTEALSPRAGRPALVYGGGIIFRSDAGLLECRPHTVPSYDRATLQHHDYVLQPSTFWTRSLWDEVGELDDGLSYVMDWDWWLRAASVCDFQPLRRMLSLYREHPQHKTGSGSSRRRAEVLTLVRAHADGYWSDLYDRTARALERQQAQVNTARAAGHSRRRLAYGVLRAARDPQLTVAALRRRGDYMTAFNTLL